ncbi:type IV toxin-antitoxin system AbiEi family antitoxin domain-containing protein [Isoptericola sp. NPDC019693]|uniref:type IV toxin-antitoxin system AbiEi family antitoxin domain-containing protein n=1 Tax=Isoptericola sp. NPDC019693 TaxID=3364009 RepID=UPI003787B3D4
MRPLSPPPTRALDLARSQDGLITTAQCEAAGMTRTRLARMAGQGRWVRVAPGVYDTDPVPVDHRERPDFFDHRRRRAAWRAVLALGPNAMPVGQCALVFHDVRGLPTRIAPEASVPGSARLPRDVAIVRQYDPTTPTVLIAGRKVPTVLHALAQAVPTLDRRHAVAVLDNAVHQGLITRAEVERAHDLARGRRGVERTHDWWRLVDGRAESPLETAVRLECVDADVPPDDLQRVLVDRRGIFLGRGDMVWRLPDGRWFWLEADGSDVHAAPAALYDDRRRQNALVADGSVVMQRVTGRDLRVPGTLGREVAARLRRLGWTPGQQLPQVTKAPFEHGIRIAQHRFGDTDPVLEGG